MTTSVTPELNYRYLNYDSRKLCAFYLSWISDCSQNMNRHIEISSLKNPTPLGQISLPTCEVVYDL